MVSRRWLAAAVILAAAAVLVIGSVLIWQAFFGWRPWMMGGPARRSGHPLPSSFESNGEQIYFTGQSASGPQITFEMDGQGPGPMGGMQGGRMACADCHGADGRGGAVRMMMSTFEAPDIRYAALTGDGHGDEHEEHEPYSGESVRRAITEGVNPAGQPLDWPMPRWNMTGDQLDDLIAYLQTLE